MVQAVAVDQVDLQGAVDQVDQQVQKVMAVAVAVEDTLVKVVIKDMVVLMESRD